MDQGFNTSQEKSPGIAVLLSLLFTGAGQIYAGNTGRGITLLIVYFVLTVLTAVSAGVMAVVLIPFWIWGMVDANNQANIYNSNISATVQHNKEALTKAKLEEDKTISSSEFVTLLGKIAKLHGAKLLNDEEFKTRKKDLILKLIDRKPKECAEDFLTALIPPIERKYLNDEEIAQIKNLVL